MQVTLDFQPVRKNDPKQLLELWCRYFNFYETKVKDDSLTVSPNVYEKREGRPACLSFLTSKEIVKTARESRYSVLLIPHKKSFTLKVVPLIDRNYSAFEPDEKEAEVFASKVALVALKEHEPEVVLSEMRKLREVGILINPSAKSFSERVKEELKERAELSFKNAKKVHIALQKLRFLGIKHEHHVEFVEEYLRVPMHYVRINQPRVYLDDLVFAFENSPSLACTVFVKQIPILP